MRRVNYDRELSPTQRHTLQVALAQGGLERWQGGFWTHPGCPVSHQQLSAHAGRIDVPEWYVTFTTVYSLQRRGYLDFTDYSGRMETRAAPTEKARSL